VDLNRSRDLGYAALERHDREQALLHPLGGLAPERSERLPKSDAHPHARRTPRGMAPGERPLDRAPASERAD
jgi:hypothetical protein